MYHDYFQLDSAPFSISPDPEYLYMSPGHEEALAHLNYGLQTGGSFVLLTGEVGTGKTTICRSLFERLPDDIDFALILNPKLTGQELLESICSELGIALDARTTTKALLDRINHYLLEVNARGRKTVLFIDEAQNLSLDVLEQLRLLTNLETDKHKLLHIVLLGQPELRDKINQPQLQQLAQRISARYHLTPLNFRETRAYVQHRLQVAGCDQPLFSAAALKRVYRLSGGVPRMINLICDRALLGAYSRRQLSVSARLVRQAGREVLDLPGPSAKRTVSWLAAAGLALLLVGAAAVGVNRFDPAGPSTTVVTALNQSPAELSGPQNGPIKPQSNSTDPLESLSAGPPAEPRRHPPAREKPELPRQWPDSFGFDSDAASAFAALAGLWGLSYPDGQPSSCAFAVANDLRCFKDTGSLTDLRALGLPAVLTLYDDQGQPFYVLLTSLQDERMEVVAAGQRRLLASAALEKRWFGEFSLFWHPPRNYTNMLGPGGSGPLVDWLSNALDQLDLYRSSGREVRLQDALLGALKTFQFQAELAPDGVLGPRTLIMLNQALDNPAPRLLAEKGN